MKTIKEFVEAYKAKTFMLTKNGVDEKIEYIKKELELKEYVPFADKRELCSAVIEACCTKENGQKGRQGRKWPRVLPDYVPPYCNFSYICREEN